MSQVEASLPTVLKLVVVDFFGQGTLSEWHHVRALLSKHRNVPDHPVSFRLACRKGPCCVSASPRAKDMRRLQIDAVNVQHSH